MLLRIVGLAVACVLLTPIVGCNNDASSSADNGSSAGSSSSTDSNSSDSASSEPDSADKWAEHTQNLPFIVGYEKGLAEAKARNKPAMLFVTTTWCGYCTKLAHENFTNAEIKDLLGKFVLVIVDGDAEASALSTLGATEGFPHIIFQSASGEKLGEQLGYVPVPDFKQAIEAALKKAGQS